MNGEGKSTVDEEQYFGPSTGPWTFYGHQTTSILPVASDLPVAVTRLVRNPVYVCVVVALSVDIFNMGYFTFLPKYLQTYFELTPAQASITSGGWINW